MKKVLIVLGIFICPFLVLQTFVFATQDSGGGGGYRYIPDYTPPVSTFHVTAPQSAFVSPWVNRSSAPMCTVPASSVYTVTAPQPKTWASAWAVSSRSTQPASAAQAVSPTNLYMIPRTTSNAAISTTQPIGGATLKLPQVSSASVSLTTVTPNAPQASSWADFRKTESASCQLSKPITTAKAGIYGATAKKSTWSTPWSTQDKKVSYGPTSPLKEICELTEDLQKDRINNLANKPVQATAVFSNYNHGQTMEYMRNLQLLPEDFVGVKDHSKYNIVLIPVGYDDETKISDTMSSLIKEAKSAYSGVSALNFLYYKKSLPLGVKRIDRLLMRADPEELGTLWTKGILTYLGSKVTPVLVVNSEEYMGGGGSGGADISGNNSKSVYLLNHELAHNLGLDDSYYRYYEPKSILNSTEFFTSTKTISSNVKTIMNEIHPAISKTNYTCKGDPVFTFYGINTIMNSKVANSFTPMQKAIMNANLSK